MEQFPHLNFIRKVVGNPRISGGGGTHPQTAANKSNRPSHRDFLSSKTKSIKSGWSESYETRESEKLAELDKEIIPLFLHINPDLLSDISFDLQSLGIEIISEEEDGFILGASIDGLSSLEEKINGFVDSSYGTAKIADLWEIIGGNRSEWKPKHVLSEELLSKWGDIVDGNIYNIEVGIAFDKPIGKRPDPNKQGGAKRLEVYEQNLLDRDDLLITRESHFADFINHYGAITSSLVNLEDSFTCEVEINGKGLKDLVINYPFVFEVSEVEEIGGFEVGDETIPDEQLEVLSPEEDSPEIVVIDSGIMENHRLLAPAIDSTKSSSYVHGGSTADYVVNGGHGTRVASALLFPDGISGQTSPYRLPFFIRNVRVLDNNNVLNQHFPASLMVEIVAKNADCNIFNLSINSNSPFRKKHMSSWAASIDHLIYENDILFVISTGNINRNTIKHYLNGGKNYPDYLEEPFCRIANPAQSSFGITVGSINHTAFEDTDWKSLGLEDEVSAFSRAGIGIWGEIKPDLVEYGGGLVSSKNGLNLVKENSQTALELLRSTMHGGSGSSKDAVGTSFSTPKVAHVAGQLRKLYPNEDVNLIRALLVQGARLPNGLFRNPTLNSISLLGYGLPSLERVTKNTEHRITFYNTGNITAQEGHIYSVSIPEAIRTQSNDFDILIEVTLSYTAKIRRTRQKTKSYLSTWLDWSSSYFDESLSDFQNRALRKINGEDTNYTVGGDVVQWKIRKNKDWGDAIGLNRNNSTLQKDWTIFKAYSLSEEISFAVRGHKGWDKEMEEIPYALVVSIEVLDKNVPIYQAIKIENEVDIQIET